LPPVQQRRTRNWSAPRLCQLAPSKCLGGGVRLYPRMDSAIWQMSM
jgi:hypothetical protein